MTLQQQALHVIEGLPDDQLSQVIQFQSIWLQNLRQQQKVGQKVKMDI